MSRLQTMSPAAVKAFFSPDSDEQVVVLLEISGANIGATPIRLADAYTKRLSETDDDVVYGITSRGNDYLFLPLEITLPGDEDGAAPTAQLTIHNVTRLLTPVLRGLSGIPNVKLEVVLASAPDVVEVSFSGFRLSGFSYTSDTVTGQLTVDALTAEPFPCHTFTPSNFPGLF